MTQNTRDRLIRAAHDLFVRSGMRAVGLEHILDAVGISKSTFYNHFDSKEDLVQEVLLWHARWWRDEFFDILCRHGGDAPRDQLAALPQVMAEVFNAPDYNGCFFINVAVEHPVPHDPAHQAARTHKLAMVDALRRLAGYANARDPAALASELAMILDGAYVTRQVNGDCDAVATLQRLIPVVLEQHLPLPVA